jgi:glutaredoxin-related protein
MYSGFSRRLVDALTKERVHFQHFDILQDDAVRQVKISQSAIGFQNAQSKIKI